MFGLEDMTEPQGQPQITISYFMLSLLGIADQTKIIHWQTPYDTEHRHFGLLFESLVEQIDTLVEAIAGKYGKAELKFGEAAIQVRDYEASRQGHFEMMDEVLRGQFAAIFDRDSDSELYNLVDEILDTKNKVQYLLQFQ